MVSATSSAEFLLCRSAGRSGFGVVREVHPGGHAVCVEETAKCCWSEAGGTDGRTERAVDILVWG